ncbi:TPA: hypothetical protein MFN13_003600, partial [Klebsiella pneumoniae]|nr:hypothetical protein [Klebsiella pneumoniae]
FDEDCEFPSILSPAKKRDTYHIDGTSSPEQNNLREINYEKHHICCRCHRSDRSFLRRLCRRTGYPRSG